MTHNASPAHPEAIEPPIDLKVANHRMQLWEGAARLNEGESWREGIASVFLEMQPSPKFRFEFRPSVELTMFDALRHPRKGIATLDAGQPIGTVECSVAQHGECFLGTILEQKEVIDPSTQIASLKFLVINGPIAGGSPIRRGNGVYCGRIVAETENAKVEIDLWMMRILIGKTYLNLPMLAGSLSTNRLSQKKPSY